jgi:DNA-binding IclR family transcriptional regulator
MAEDTWDAIAVPILEIVARVEGRTQRLTVGDLCEELGLPESDADRVVIEVSRLLDGDFIGGTWRRPLAPPTGSWIAGPFLTERGARTVGRWPSEDLYEGLLQQLNRASEETTDPERKALLKKVAGTVGEVGQGVLTNVLASFVKATAGLP